MGNVLLISTGIIFWPLSILSDLQCNFGDFFGLCSKNLQDKCLLVHSCLCNISDWFHGLCNIILVWLTCQTPAVGGLIVCVSECVCESVGPKTCRHIARRMMNG